MRNSRDFSCNNFSTKCFLKKRIVQLCYLIECFSCNLWISFRFFAFFYYICNLEADINIFCFQIEFNENVTLGAMLSFKVDEGFKGFVD